MIETTTKRPEATESMGNGRYSPTLVRRYVDDTLVCEYPDATVRDQGESGRLRLPQAMLRAYSNDVSVNNEHDEHFVCIRPDHVKHYGEGFKGFVLDCDGDIALERILGVVLSKHSFGHGHERWSVLVSQNDDGGWDGWGSDSDPQRIERWEVSIASAEDVAASREGEES